MTTTMLTILAAAAALLIRVWHLSTRRHPDIDIGPGYLKRWYVIPRNPLFNIYLHHIIRDDDDRALHCHPWLSVSWCLRGKLREYYAHPSRASYPRCHLSRVVTPSLLPRVRRPTMPHRLTVIKPAVTLFITGPRVREWGFWCPKGWRHWKEFTAADDSSRIGRGCGG